MSGAGAGGGGHHGLYYGGDGDPTAGFDPDDVDSFFFRRSPCAAAEGGGGLNTACYSSTSITDYLQGFLLQDGSAPSRLADDNDVVKQEMAAHQAVIGQHDVDQHQLAAAGASATPPSSSVLSSSSPISEAGGGEDPRRRRCKKARPEEEEEEIGDDDEEEESAADPNNRKKSGKGEKEKKARQPRVAFKTKSEVDHLEDGYRWRKYGQKAVKNSTYPRSYYRCTAARCGVKKLVERSQQDPSSVITTYEGQHTHPSPAGLAARARTLMHNGFSPSPMMQPPPPHNGFMPGSSSSLLPPGNSDGNGIGMPPPMMHLLQQDHHRTSSRLAATYGGALGFVPSAMGDIKQNEHG